MLLSFEASVRSHVHAGCHASLPVTGRQLLCFGDVSIGGHKALSLPGQKLVMGNVQLKNGGGKPIALQQANFKLSGLGGPIDGGLKCPGLTIPAGGSLQVRCGHTSAPADWEPLSRAISTWLTKEIEISDHQVALHRRWPECTDCVQWRSAAQSVRVT